MNNYKITYKPYGSNAILVEWPQLIEGSILKEVRSFTKTIKEFLNGSWELVPAYNSILIIGDAPIVNYNLLEQELRALYLSKEDQSIKKGSQWILPVYYGSEYALDIEKVALHNKISIEEVIQLHTNTVYTVFAIGFLPGFMYLGGLDPKIETPRKEQPRLKVEKGAVGIANNQTGIYPQESPGGWNIIGNCPIPIFDIKKEQPCFVSVGDEIIFRAVSKPQFLIYEIEVKTGVYKLEKSVK